MPQWVGLQQGHGPSREVIVRRRLAVLRGCWRLIDLRLGWWIRRLQGIVHILSEARHVAVPVSATVGLVLLTSPRSALGRTDQPLVLGPGRFVI